jgi:hypothetical protein
MRIFAFVFAFLTVSSAIADETSHPMQMLNLSCMEALVAVDQAGLAGVFSYISEKDGPAAFADLLAHNKKALNKFLDKTGKDLKSVSGIAAWDHDVFQALLAIYASPLAETLDKPNSKTMTRLEGLAHAPTLTLDQMTSRRRAQ